MIERGTVIEIFALYGGGEEGIYPFSKLFTEFRRTFPEWGWEISGDRKVEIFSWRGQKSYKN